MQALAERHRVPEIMDDLYLDRPVHTQALVGLAALNRTSFADLLFWEPLRKHFRGPHTARILDMACGAGDNALSLARRARKEGLPYDFEGCDFNPQAVIFARQRACREGVDARYFVMDVLKEPVPGGYDALLNSLFLHHLDEEQLAAFLKKLLASSAKLIVLTDLKRSWAGLALAYVATRLLTRSPVVHADGPQSVRAALTPPEIMNVIRKAGLPLPQLEHVWPERYRLVWWRP
ncbi:MAG TPA: methyltransferase domain-containing protein [Verrucomicrobiae bacterium]|nr:methyltransferase domain-containing protein [Verrucomicrobiae bacterium]